MGGVYSIAGAIVTLAIIGVLFTNSNTASIISAVTNGFANALKAAKP
jgi:hypothetical protein